VLFLLFFSPPFFPFFPFAGLGPPGPEPRIGRARKIAPDGTLSFFFFFPPFFFQRAAGCLRSMKKGSVTSRGDLRGSHRSFLLPPSSPPSLLFWRWCRSSISEPRRGKCSGGRGANAGFFSFSPSFPSTGPTDPELIKFLEDAYANKKNPCSFKSKKKNIQFLQPTSIPNKQKPHPIQKSQIHSSHKKSQKPPHTTTLPTTKKLQPQLTPNKKPPDNKPSTNPHPNPTHNPHANPPKTIPPPTQNLSPDPPYTTHNNPQITTLPPQKKQTTPKKTPTYQNPPTSQHKNPHQ